MLEVPAGVAQLAEQPSCKRQVSGSIPLTGSSSVLVFEQPVGSESVSAAILCSHHAWLPSACAPKMT
jgi:hypothetical protein